MLDAVTGSLFSNMITFTLLFGLWRLTKNERDWFAMIICLICFGVVALVAIAARS